jgi:chemotaxis-related protein WspB
MLFLQFKISGNSYILEARDIIEIVPYANLQRIPQAPDYLAGLLNYRGDTIPVVDICYLMSGKPCELKLSSRIAMTNYMDEDGRSVCIGLLIERLTETAIYKVSDFSDSGVALEDSPYLGKVIVDDKHIIQLVSVREIIPEAAHDILFHSIPSGA